MRKFQKKQTEEFVYLLCEAHDEIIKALENNDYNLTMDLLFQCQEGAATLGNFIENLEGEGFVTITVLEEYCELIYHIYESVNANEVSDIGAVRNGLEEFFVRINDSIKNDIKIRKEIVFLPYKASMWDSLESVWMAADADPECDAYVIPIPYYERNSDGTLGTYHYEGGDMPEYVPVTHYEEYDFAARRPDAVYIHNPYDHGNYVTSIDPRFYSKNLKRYTDCLVYIPYYSTSGDMHEGQSSCIVYYYADYIVTQAESFRKFFDEALPDKKFLPFGSPKFDRIIRMCNNPPEPPASWKRKMEGKKVYFYNTSINGMLQDTENFLKKMRYVFDCFKERNDVCILWRPHPLLESTFDSMRWIYREQYNELKRDFIENEIGIYDDTPDIEKTIAQCDAYIGDIGSSVVSLFGIAGKPLFILNNKIHTAPGSEDWRGEIIPGFLGGKYDKWIIVKGNKLYYSNDNDYKYKYYCDLLGCSKGGRYMYAYEINGKVYVCPVNTQNILVVSVASGKVEKKIELDKRMDKGFMFRGAIAIGQYLFLIPAHYPAIVRYDTANDRIDYIEGYNDVFTEIDDGTDKFGGGHIWKKYLLLASPTDSRVLAINSETMNVQLLNTGADNMCGCAAMNTDCEDVWLLPYSGKVVTKWDPVTGTVKEYDKIPEDFVCRIPPTYAEIEDMPFGQIAFGGDRVVLSPLWGNKLLSLDRKTGEFKEFKLSVDMPQRADNIYYGNGRMGDFLPLTDGEEYKFLCISNRKLYDVNLETGDCKEIPIEFDYEELALHEEGFMEAYAEKLYCCRENVFNSLGDFLDDKITRNVFDKDKQLKSYSRIVSNNDGTCGEKVHEFIMSRI